MRMAWGDEWTGSEWVRCTELRLWLGMLLLPPGLANHRFCMGHRKTEQWVGREKAQAQEWWSWQSPLPTKLGPPGHKHMETHITGTTPPPTPEVPGSLLPAGSPVGPGPQGWGW